MEENDGNFLDSIDLDELFLGMGDDDVLPDLEIIMDPGQESDMMMNMASLAAENENENDSGKMENLTVSPSASDLGLGSLKEADERRKSSPHYKVPPGKKKKKVDWTPELHRRFVKAVEEVGLDKAVPSMILEIMATDSLTRHNIASHLQKYRSHRKHLLAREGEAASWSRRRQMYGTVAAVGGAWINAPTMGFPLVSHFRLLHVWGHPHVDQSLITTWPKHLAPPPHAWPSPPPPPPPDNPYFWHSHLDLRFPAPPVPALPPPAPSIGVPAGRTLPRTPSDVHPSKERIDAVIEDAITKPWLPLPIGLKPPSIDSVMVELQRQDIS